MQAFTSSEQALAACANSSSPICYNTALSGANIITNLWLSAVLGALCYIGFIIYRGKFRFYEARLDMPQVTHKPPELNKKGLARVWSWIKPVFLVSDEDLLLSAGMDALVRIFFVVGDFFGLHGQDPLSKFNSRSLASDDNDSSVSDCLDAYAMKFLPCRVRVLKENQKGNSPSIIIVPSPSEFALFIAGGRAHSLFWYHAFSTHNIFCACHPFTNSLFG